MKVVFCTDGIFPHTVGGMQRHSKLLIEELASNSELELTVIHPHKEIVFDPELKINEIHVAPINRKKNYLLECYKYSKRIYRELKQLDKDIIYSQGLSVWYNIKRLDEQLVINPHGLEPYQGVEIRDKLIGIPFRYVFNFLFSGSSRVVSLGGKLTQILRDNIKKKNKVIELANAVNIPMDSTERNFQSSQKLKLFFISRFVSNKGIHILIQAIQELNDEGYIDALEYNLAGKGPLHEHYKTNFKFSNVNYLGFVSDDELQMHYNINDAFVFPTLFEGMPTVVLEAMSFGMPIIVSDTGATSELVDSSNGFLIEKNSVEQLKKAIKELYHLSPEGKKTLSNNSLQKVRERFTWKRVADRHYKLFQALSP